ncbi:alcohol O-acetyltransferase 1 [Podospora australis]|uniref:Alcohol O-acetyltransferase 1 n=1 Tax=Podospora australis TaxID=1536484 RepID=A0AAN7AEW1_9PEZI|nr:alcohol O-acetyltransferase 1 [Podospora australis]
MFAMSVLPQPSLNLSSDFDRPLGPAEKYSSSRHALGFYKSVINTCRYTVSRTKLQGLPVRNVFEEAIASVILKTPSLSVGIVGQDTPNPYFCAVPTVDLRCQLRYTELPVGDDHGQNSALLGLIEEQHDQFWPSIESRPPWKAIIVSQGADGDLLYFNVIFAAHHSIADGRSTAAFHAMLLDELLQPSARPALSSGHVLTVSGNRKLKPPLEGLVSFPKSWAFLSKTLFRELGPVWLQKRLPIPWTGNNITREPYKTHLRLVTIPATSAPRVLAACRKHRVTLTPLIHALVLVSLAKHIPHARAFRSSTPIDLRPFIQWQVEEPQIPFGVFITTQAHLFEHETISALQDDRIDDTMWSIASTLRNDMKQHLQSVPRDDIMGMLSWVSDWKKFWLQKIGARREDTWEVSNIGSLAVTPLEDTDAGAGGWRIERSILSQGATVAGAAIGVNVAGVTGGSICISLSWQHGIVESGVVEGLAAYLQQSFDQL